MKEKQAPMNEEIFDICDVDDRVIGQRPRTVVHEQHLLHRAVHIWIWNPDGELLLQLRTATKDQYPSCYTSSASGHVDAGENYEAAAVRELWEELKLRGDLLWGTKIPAAPQTAYEHTVLFHLQSNELPQPDPDEIAEIEFLSTDRIADMLQATPELFTPPFRMLFAEWRQQERELAEASDGLFNDGVSPDDRSPCP